MLEFKVIILLLFSRATLKVTKNLEKYVCNSGIKWMYFCQWTKKSGCKNASVGCIYDSKSILLSNIHPNKSFWQIYIQTKVFDKYTSTVILLVVKMAMFPVYQSIFSSVIYVLLMMIFSSLSFQFFLSLMHLIAKLLVCRSLYHIFYFSLYPINWQITIK